MKNFDLISPEGTRDLILADCCAVRSVEERLHNIFKAGGYNEVITPGIEFYDVFNQKSRYFPQESMYKLVDGKGRLLVVRPDSTMPIARVVSTRLREQPLPIRLFYSQNVFRMKPGMRGRSDEIRQTGIELIGSSSERADIEVIYKAIEALSSLRSGSFRLEIGHIGYFKELVRTLGADSETVEKIRGFIEAKNYPALNDLLDEFSDNPSAAALKQLPRLFGEIEVIDKAESIFSDEETERVLSQLKWIYSEISSLGFDDKITIDLGLVNRMDYYTGIVMKGYLHGFGDAVLSGGRYDGLLSEYGYDVPATGFAVNVDAAAKVLRNDTDFTPTPPDMLVFGEKGHEAAAADYCSRMAKHGKTAENALCSTREEAEEYAAKKGIKQLAVVSDTIRVIEL